MNTHVSPQPQPEPLNPADAGQSAVLGAPGRRRPQRPERPMRAERGGLRAFLIIVGVFAVLGIAAGVVWQQLAPQVEMRMTEVGPYPVSELEAGQLMSMDGWYAALAGCLGLIAGSVLATVFLKHAWTMVLSVLAGSCLAAILAFTVGTVMGNGEIIVAWQPEAKLWSPLSAPLQLHAYGVALIWPIAALAPIVPLAWWAWPIAELDGPEGMDGAETVSAAGTPDHPDTSGWPPAPQYNHRHNAE